MFRFNIPIRKVDEEKRLVYGLVTEQIVDQAGEILDYDTSKAYFQAWSEGISKATNGASLGNLRLMHQPVIAGKIIELIFDDVLKQISCVAKIVDDNVWKLVLEGCLTGFSMGGKYMKRWKDAADKAITWFTAKPVEVSVVDNPCVSTATFEYVKSDGSVELRKFHSMAGDGEGEEDMFTQEQIAAKAAELAKAAGTPDATDQFMDEALVQLEGDAELAKAAADAAEEDKEEEESDEDKAKKAEDEAEAEKAKAAAEEEAEAEKAKAAAEDDKTAAAEEEPEEKDDKDKKKEDEEDDDTEKTVVAEPTPEELEAARADAATKLVQVWQAPDGSTHTKKAAAVDHIIANPDAPAVETDVEKALRLASAGAAAEPAPAAPLGDLPERIDVVAKGLKALPDSLPEVAKGMYSVTSLSRTIEEFQWIVSCALSEQAERGDGSAVAGKLWEALSQMGEALIEMAQEEIAILMQRLKNQWPNEEILVDVVELAAVVEMTKANTTVMEKAALIPVEDDVAKTEITDELLEETDLVKSLRAENEKQSTEITKAVEGIATLGTTIATMQEQIEKFGKSPQPLPPRTDHVTVERHGKTETVTAETLEKMSPDDRMDLAIRLAQMNPQQKMQG